MRVVVRQGFYCIPSQYQRDVFFRSSQITAGVTHVVIGDRNDGHMRQLEHADFRQDTDI